MATNPPPLSYIVRLVHPVNYQRARLIKADSLAGAQAIAAALVVCTEWTVASVTPYTR